MKHLLFSAFIIQVTLLCFIHAVSGQDLENKAGKSDIENLHSKNEKISHFSVGWAYTATHYSTANKDFVRPFYSRILTQGNEFQFGININRKWSVISGINLNLIGINSIPYQKGVNAAVNRHNVYINQISYPIYILYKIIDNDKVFYQQLVTGIYFGTILNSYYINQYFNYGKGWQESGSYTNGDPKTHFYNLYGGTKINYRISNQFHLGFEPFISYQLENNQIIINVYNRLLFGFKINLMYNFLNARK